MSAHGTRMRKDVVIVSTNSNSLLGFTKDDVRKVVETTERGWAKFENCYENAPMESFWSQVKADRHAHNMFDDLRQARLVVYS